MNGKQAKHARRVEYQEAVRQNLWKKGEKSLYAKWWRPLLAAIFPKRRKAYSDAVGRWYRRVLKTWSRNVYEYEHDPERREFERIKHKLAKRREKKRIAARIAATSGGR